jgi:hypothetical protein
MEGPVTVSTIVDAITGPFSRLYMPFTERRYFSVVTALAPSWLVTKLFIVAKAVAPDVEGFWASVPLATSMPCTHTE